MSLLNKIGKSVFNALEMAGRARTLSQLETMSDRALEDLGFSRLLMNQGVSAWPWKKDQEVIAQKAKTSSDEINAAIKELNSYNDKDLADLGLSRGEIRNAVINGRKNDEQVHAA